MRSSRAVRPLGALFLVFLLGMASAAPSRAQEATRNAAAERAYFQPDSTQAARFQLADAYFRAGQFDRAVFLLEDLMAAAPGNFAFFDKLKQAYESLKRYDDAIALVDRWAEGNRNPVVLADRARLLFLKGDEAGAYAAWDAAVALAPEDRNTYRAVYHSLMQVRLFDRAITMLERGRRHLGEEDFFRSDLAYLYSLTGKHEQAMAEYLAVLSDNERQLSFVRSRLNRFLEQPEAVQSSIAVAERAVRKEPLNRAYRELLAWLYLEAGAYRQALDANRAIDRLEGENGLVLFSFAQTAVDAEAFDVSLEAYEEILKRYPDGVAAPQARFSLAETHERWAEKLGERAVDAGGDRLEAPHYEAARDAYRTFLQAHAGHALYPEALRRLGHLQQQVFFNLGEAETALEEVLRRYPDTPAADQAAYDLGITMLLRDRLGEARLRFARLEERLRLGELAELARYELALLHFYQGEFDAAQTIVQALDANTSTEVANDAITLKVLLLENRGPDSLNTPLRRFAEMNLRHRQRRYAETLGGLEALIADHASHPLADDARFLRAQVLRQAGRPADALAAFAELPLLHPGSYLADLSLFLAGEIQERELLTPDAAIETYTRLLTTYPGSLYAPDARTRIRRLRGDGA